MKTKQLEKGLLQLMEEGVAQLFTYELGKKKVVGVVGALQFEVIQFRLKNEYSATVQFVPQNIYKACWISSNDPRKLAEFIDSSNAISRATKTISSCSWPSQGLGSRWCRTIFRIYNSTSLQSFKYWQRRAWNSPSP